MTNIIRIIEIEKGDTILEVGCATGRFASEFVRLYAMVTCLDLSEEVWNEHDVRSQSYSSPIPKQMLLQ